MNQPLDWLTPTAVKVSHLAKLSATSRIDSIGSRRISMALKMSALVIFALMLLVVPEVQGQIRSSDIKPAARVASRPSEVTSRWLQESQIERPELEPEELSAPAGIQAVVKPARPISQSDQERGQEVFGDGSLIPQWPAKTIQQIRVGMRESDARVPEDRSVELAGFGGPASKPTSSKVFAWAAPNLRYQPLYFEEVALERYGQTLPPYQQSVASSLHFFRSLVTLPHQMRHDHPNSCDSPLGFCRPGNTIPYTIQRQYFGRSW